MSEQPSVVYLEADDEVTSVVRRVREADGDAVIVVAPGRSRAVSSVVALRLLARAADGAGRSLVLVGDALTRSLAGEAGVTAFASLDEARRVGPTAPAVEPTRASISVVRGPVAADAAPTMTAAPLTVTADEVTRTVALPRPGAKARRPLQARRRRRLPVAVVAAVGALLLASLVAAAAVLPAAVITIVPRTDPVGPVRYEIAAGDVERIGGSVTASVEVTATGTYEVQESATGVVVLLNWTFVPVTVEAGTFVAAGEQAFATQADVVVPRGSLTDAGTIAAGEAEVAVVAAAVGPNANVGAGAIDTVLPEAVDSRLRGFPENPERTVTNPQPTSGGVDTGGPEVTQADVDAAVATLREQLETLVDAELPDGPMVVTDPQPSEPVITGQDGLVGRRDAPSTTIRGELEWAAHVVDEEAVRTEALERFLADEGAVPGDRQLLEDSVEVALEPPTLDGGTVRVVATVNARSTTRIDAEAIRRSVAGATPAEVRSVLEALGAVHVQLWPGWLSTVPTLDWRIEVNVAEADAEGARR